MIPTIELKDAIQSAWKELNNQKKSQQVEKAPEKGPENQ